jgi:hypothetical protein
MILGQNERGWNWAAEFDYFEFGLKELDSSQKDLNIFKLNLNLIQNKINSIKLFGKFSKTKFWNLV